MKVLITIAMTIKRQTSDEILEDLEPGSRRVLRT